MDASVVQLTTHPHLYLISTTDFFYPLVHDPFIQGQIACANVLSDLYALGVTEIDSILMLLGVSRTMPDSAQTIVTIELIRGFNATARTAKTNVTGGQTVMNPWPIIGGVAMSVRTNAEFIRPVNAQVGNVLVLTKPLGTQVAVNAYEWLRQRNAPKSGLSIDETHRAYWKAIDSMKRLNQPAAALMHTCQATAATDVTGFGILGHAQTLVAAQRLAVDFEFDTLPMLAHMVAVDAATGGMFRLRDGHSAETSGGLLVCLPADQAETFVTKLTRHPAGGPAWVVGQVVAGTRQARICSSVTILDV